MGRAQSLWQQYRLQGEIEANQRADSVISAAFRTRARLLAEADGQAGQALGIHAQFDAPPASWRVVREEIRAETEKQRNALLALRNVLEPALLQSKLALLGEALP
jgi:hypothetical protein